MPETREQCPQLYLKTKDQTKAFKVVEEFKYSLTNVENCCNVHEDSLSITMINKKPILQVAYFGRDCFGGTAQWFTEEIYDIDLKRHELRLKQNKKIGMH